MTLSQKPVSKFIKGASRFSLFLFLMGIAFACSLENTHQTEGPTFEGEEETAKKIAKADSFREVGIVNESAEMLFSGLPNPIHLIRIFKNSGLEYQPALELPDGWGRNTNSTQARGLALGFFTAHLGYAVLNNQNQQALNYLKQIRSQADALNLDNINANQGLLSELERNIGKPDSMLKTIGKLQLETDILLKESNRWPTLSISATAAITEGLYLAICLLDKKGNPDLLEKILNQHLVIDKLRELNQVYYNDQDKASIIEDLKNLQNEMKISLQGPAEERATSARTKVAPLIKEFRTKLFRKVE